MTAMRCRLGLTVIACLALICVGAAGFAQDAVLPSETPAVAEIQPTAAAEATARPTGSPAAATGARVLVYAVNNEAMDRADPSHTLINASLTLLALLPDDAMYACIAATQGAPADASAWQTRADATALSGMASRMVSEETGKLGAVGVNEELLATLTALLGGGADSAAGPTAVVALNATSMTMNQPLWEQIRSKAAGGSLELVSYAGGSYHKQKNEDLLTELFDLKADQTGALAGNGLRLCLLIRAPRETYWSAPVDEACALLTRELGLVEAEADVTAVGGGYAFTAQQVPTLGASDVRMLVENLPEQSELRVTDAGGAQRTLQPVLKLGNGLKGRENRVYALDRTQLGAEARFTVLPAAVETTAQPDQATVESAPAPTATGAFPASGPQGAPRVRFFFRFDAALNTRPQRLDSADRKNEAFPVEVEFDSQELRDGVLANAASYEVFVRCEPEDGLEPALDFPAVYDDRLGMFCAEVKVTHSGGYTLRSGVRGLIGAGTETLSAAERSLTVRIANQAPEPAETEKTVQLLINPPSSSARTTADSGADGPSGNPVVFEQELDLRSLFDDPDDPDETLSYRISSSPSEPEAEASACQLTVPDLFSAAIRPDRTGVKICAQAEALDGIRRSGEFYLIVEDSEKASAAVRVTVSVVDIRKALETTSLRLEMLGEPTLDASGAWTRAVRVRLVEGGAPSAAVAGRAADAFAEPAFVLPESLRTLLWNNLKVEAVLSPKGENTAATAATLASLNSGLWEGTIAEPLQTDTYALSVRGSLPGADAADAPWSASGWTDNAAGDEIRVIYESPILLTKPSDRIRYLFLREGDGASPTSAQTYEMQRLFQGRSARSKLDYTVRVTDGQGRPAEAVCLALDSGLVARVIVGGTETYIRELIDQSPEGARLHRLSGSAPEAQTAAEPAGASAAGRTEATPDGTAALLGVAAASEGQSDQAAAAAPVVTVDLKAPGEYAVEFRAVDRDSSPTLYREPVRVIRLWMLLAGIMALALIVALAVGLIIRTVRHLLAKPFSRNMLLLKVESAEYGELEVSVLLSRWKKRVLPLTELLLLGAFPILPWLDAVARNLRIAPTRKGPVLRLKGRAKSMFMVGQNDRRKHAKIDLKEKVNVQLTERNDPRHTLSLGLSSDRQDTAAPYGPVPRPQRIEPRTDARRSPRGEQPPRTAEDAPAWETAAGQPQPQPVQGRRGSASQPYSAPDNGETNGRTEPDVGLF